MSNSVSKLFDQESVPAIKADSNGFVLDINKIFETTYGYSRDSLIGKPLVTIIPSELRNSHHIGFSRFMHTEKSKILNQAINLSIQHANGMILSAEHYIVAEMIENQWVFAASIKLIDGKK